LAITLRQTLAPSSIRHIVFIITTVVSITPASASVGSIISHDDWVVARIFALGVFEGIWASFVHPCRRAALRVHCKELWLFPPDVNETVLHTVEVIWRGGGMIGLGDADGEEGGGWKRRSKAIESQRRIKSVLEDESRGSRAEMPKRAAQSYKPGL
jgi:hypothetical protein